jgi:hypothetical protein
MAVTVVVMELTRRFSMANVTYGGEDPGDWTPEDNKVATDPLDMGELDDRWIQFYADRAQYRIEKMLNEEG